jgi:hypothetical protein
VGFTTEELDELEKVSPSPQGMTLEASPSNKFTTEDLDSMEGKMVSPPSPEGNSTWEGIKSKFKEFSESPTVQEMKYRSGFPQAMEFFGGGKRAVDVAAGALTDPLETGLVDPRKGNEAGQLVGNLLVKGLNPYEMMTDPIGKTPLQESTHPAARFLQTGVESLGGLATDPNAPFIPGSKVVAAAFAPGMVEQVVSGLDQGTPEGYAEALFGGTMLGLMGKHHLKGRGKETTPIPQKRGIDPESDFARAVEESAALAPEPFKGTKKEPLPGGWSIELNSQGGYDAISPGGMKFKYPTEKAARKGVAQEIQPPPSLKPVDVEALPSIPMKPELLPGEVALPNVWEGKPLIGEEPPPPRPGIEYKSQLEALQQTPEEIAAAQAGRPTPPPPVDVDPTQYLPSREMAPPPPRSSPSIQGEVPFFGEPPPLMVSEGVTSGVPKGRMKAVPPEAQPPLPIELKATIQEAIGSGFNAKSSIKTIQEKLGIDEPQARELYWKTKRALNAEKRGGHLELEELPFKAENIPENVSTDFKNIYTKNPQVQKLHRFITNIFEAVNKTVEGAIPGEERVLENNYAGLMFKPGRNAFRYGAKGNRPEHIGGKTVGDIYVNPWSIAVEARLQENAGKIPKGSAHQYFIDKVAEAIGHEPAHARARHGEAKVKDLFTGEEVNEPFNPQKMQEDFSFQIADQSVRNNPEFNRIMEGVKSPQNDAAVKEMYKSILKDAAKVYKETLKEKKEGGGSAMEMKAPPKPKKISSLQAARQERNQLEPRIDTDPTALKRYRELDKFIYDAGRTLVETNPEYRKLSNEKVLTYSIADITSPKEGSPIKISQTPEVLRKQRRIEIEQRMGEIEDKWENPSLEEQNMEMKEPPSIGELPEAKPLKGIGRESERGAIGTGGNKPINPNAPIPPINLGGHSPSSPMGKGLSAAGSTSLLHKTWEAASGVSSSIRAFTVGGDFSSVLRQNWIQTFAHPVQSAKNVKLMVRSMTEKGYDRIADDIRKNPYFKDATDARLGLTKGLIENLPEEYMEGVEILHKGFKKAGLGSVDPFITTERAFSQYSNLTRMDSFARGMNLLEGKYGKGKIPPDVRDMLAKWINTSTGRGNFSPKWESTATNLNKILFSPRLLKARIDTPIDIARAMYKDPKLGLMAAGELARATAFVGSIVGVIAASTGATVEGDLRSADFGKIRLGNTSIDPWGGFQPYVRLAAQIASGKRKTQYGDIQDVKFGDLMQRFARSKLAPVPGFAWTAIEGKDYVGERKPLGEAKTYWDSFGIMTVRDIAEIWKQDPVLATSLTLPIALGIGTTTRPSLPTSKEVNKEYQRLRIAPPRDVESFEDRSKAPLIDRKTGKPKFERRKLSNEEFKSVKGKTDPEVYKEIEKFITSPSYKKLSDEDKTIALHKLSRQMGSFRKKRSRELLMQPPPPTSQR